MKKIVLQTLFILIAINCVYSQNVEKMFTTEQVTYYAKDVRVAPRGIFVDEVNESIEVMNGNWDGSTLFPLNNPECYVEKTDITSFWYVCNQRLKDSVVGFSNDIITLQKKKNIYATVKTNQSGISFILKKGSGYIVYYVDKTGKPGAVDTEGVIYTSEEAMGYLKEYDSEKYAQSLARAEELGLKQKFLNSEVLVWGRTYYSTAAIYKKLYGKNPYLLNTGLIQYDNQGNGYQYDYQGNMGMDMVCVDASNSRIFRISDRTLEKRQPSTYSSSWYVGFGGNIYYYISDFQETEVFRIRRTWGEPDFYAMAINGWTDDDYGDYVESVLPTLSAADLRLLRNTVFALYGYHFNSADLAAHFDKEVWYTDEGKSAADITLPAHRAKLVEMIQALEAVARQ